MDGMKPTETHNRPPSSEGELDDLGIGPQDLVHGEAVFVLVGYRWNPQFKAREHGVVGMMDGGRSEGTIQGKLVALVLRQQRDKGLVEMLVSRPHFLPSGRPRSETAEGGSWIGPVSFMHVLPSSEP